MIIEKIFIPSKVDLAFLSANVLGLASCRQTLVFGGAKRDRIAHLHAASVTKSLLIDESVCVCGLLRSAAPTLAGLLACYWPSI